MQYLSPTESPQDPLINRTLLDRYRPISLIGEGGMGRVYLAEQKMGGVSRMVALKTMHSTLFANPKSVARFRRESETVVALRHPNTIQFFDFGELEDQTLFIVMEYLEGESLADVLQRQGALPIARIDKILTQICGSLHEAHSLGIVHRDLKPENILLTNPGGQTDFVKVLDFGIAKRNDPSRTDLTVQGMILGTPPYMSPEQIMGQPLDARSDIYALGIMVYEMMTGELPFYAETPLKWTHQHLHAAPKPLHHYPQGAALDPERQTALMRTLAKNPDDRPSSVREFLQAFIGRVSGLGAVIPSTPVPALAAVDPERTTAQQASTTPPSAEALGGTLTISKPPTIEETPSAPATLRGHLEYADTDAISLVPKAHTLSTDKAQPPASSEEPAVTPPRTHALLFVGLGVFMLAAVFAYFVDFTQGT